MAKNTITLNILLVEDDPSVVESIRDGFHESGAMIDHAPTIAEGCHKLSTQPYHAIILDINLPDGRGTDIAAACRNAGNDIPIIMVTANDTIDDRIKGLQHGADDYLCKPFAVEELSARLEAVLRRSRPKHRHILKYHDMELDLLRRRVCRNKIQTPLSAREMDLLAFLMTHPEKVLSKENILKNIWGDDEVHDSNVLQVYANYLRNKTEGGLYPRLIHTIRGKGYILSHENPEDKPSIDSPRES